ncbi:hypothetical protein ACOSQ3_005196 [Xanthoceras sorbifolium]
MTTRNQTNVEFRNEVHEILGRHESSIDEVHSTLQTILTELQSLRTSQGTPANNSEVNPIAQTESSHHINQPTVSYTQPSPHQKNHHLKLNFPKFDGEDPTGWVYKFEQYLDFKAVPPEQQVQLASFHLEGIALQWHRKHYYSLLGPTDYKDSSEALTRLKQTTTVTAYQEAFEKLSHRVDDMPEPFLVGCFIAGLRDEIQLDVKIKQPRTLADAIGVARLVEKRNNLQKKTLHPSRANMFSNQFKSGPNSSAMVLGPPPTFKPNSGIHNNSSSFKRITSQEARKRREKWFCYYFE